MFGPVPRLFGDRHHPHTGSSVATGSVARLGRLMRVVVVVRVRRQSPFGREWPSWPVCDFMSMFLCVPCSSNGGAASWSAVPVSAMSVEQMHHRTSEQQEVGQ